MGLELTIIKVKHEKIMSINMDTIYEHNLSLEEIQKLGRMIPDRIIGIKKYYQYELYNDTRNADLYRLYFIRGEREKANKYFDKIEDIVIKNSLRE